jgi:hypothetical protein
MTSVPAQEQRTPWLELCLAVLPAALHALILLGRIHPDELFQSLEVALHRAYGYGILAWEWQVPGNAPNSPQPWGIRNHAIPILFAGLFKVADAIGLGSPYGRRVLVALPQCLLHLAMLGAVWRLTVRRAGVASARAAVWLVALYGPLVWFGVRTMSESFSTAFLVWGLERLDAEAEKPWAWAWGGALLGFAQITRYGSAAVILPAMLWLLLARRWRTFAFATVGGVIIGLGLGLLDRLTWGEWFHSFIHYVRFNVTSGSAAQAFGTQPWWQYVPRLLLAPFAAVGLVLTARRDAWGKRAAIAFGVLALASLGLVLAGPSTLAAAGWVALVALGVLGVVVASPGQPGPSILIAASLGYAAILSWTAHKEDRFLYPALILLTVAGAPAFASWALTAWTDRRPARFAAAVLAASGVLFFIFPSPYDVQRKEQFQLAARASKGATGLVIMNEGMWGSPGFFWLGANLPWCPCDFPHDGCFQVAARDARFNRGIFWSNQNPAEGTRDADARAAFERAGFKVVEQRGAATLFER